MKALLSTKTPFSFLLLWMILFIPNNINAQFISATLGIHGLTCSLCSYGVEREIDKLDFVENIQMDLNQNIATIVFRKDKPVHMKDLVSAVYKAGFSVGYTQALFSFDQLTIEEQLYFTYQGNQYFILERKTETLKGEHIVRFIDKKYVINKEFKLWEEKINLNNKRMPPLKKSINYQIIIL